MPDQNVVQPPTPKGSAGAPATGSYGASGATFFGGAFSVADAIAGAAGAAGAPSSPPGPREREAAQRESAAAMSEAMWVLQRELDAEKGKPNKNYKQLKHLKSLMEAQSVVDEQQALLEEKASKLRAKLAVAEQREDYDRCEELQAELDALAMPGSPNQYRGQGQGQGQGYNQQMPPGSVPGARRPTRREGLVQRTRGDTAYGGLVPAAGYNAYDPYAMSLSMYPSNLGYNPGYNQGPYNQGYGVNNGYNGYNGFSGYNSLGRRSRRDEITERTRGAFNGQGPQQGQARYNQGYAQYTGQAMGQGQGYNQGYNQFRGQGQGRGQIQGYNQYPGQGMGQGRGYNQGYNQNFRVQGPTQGVGQAYNQGYNQFGGQGQSNTYNTYNGPYNQGYNGGRRRNRGYSRTDGYFGTGGNGGYRDYGGYSGYGDRGQDSLS